MKMRNILRAFVISLALFPSAMAQAPTTPNAQPKVARLADDFFVLSGTSNGVSDVPNVAIYVTDAGVAIVDPWFEKDYAFIMAAVKSVTDKPVKYVFNTHYHNDHTGDNLHFQPAATIVAHKKAREYMIAKSMRGLPDVVVDGPASFFLGGKEIRVFPMGTGHTDGDLAVYFPAVGAVCMGDMMAGTRGVTNPVVDYSGNGSIFPWPASLDNVLVLDPKIVIPGHGEVTDRNGLLAHRNKVAQVGVRLRILAQQGRTPEEAKAELIREFDFKPINLRALDNLLAEAAKVNASSAR